MRCQRLPSPAIERTLLAERDGTAAHEAVNLVPGTKSEYWRTGFHEALTRRAANGADGRHLPSVPFAMTWPPVSSITVNEEHSIDYGKASR
jgi:hypothetical protein